jgi:hypothetical protein
MTRKAPIDWSTLPPRQRERLIVLLSRLVEHRLNAAGTAEENADEHRPLAGVPCAG